ncbi:MAG: hypothetical protein INR71_09785 [Terriglobus roseus]|nr:hypothetical protein [Terriglobus roseus]
MGGQTVGMLLGARLTDSTDETARDVDALDPRIKVGVLLSTAGNGGKDLSEEAARQYTFMHPDFSHLTTRALVVFGDKDVIPYLTRRGSDWFADAYHHAPGADCLMTVHGVGHGLAGIAGYDARETDKEDPDRLEAVRRMTWAYLRSALYEGDPAWTKASAALADSASDLARVECKRT